MRLKITEGEPATFFGHTHKKFVPNHVRGHRGEIRLTFERCEANNGFRLECRSTGQKEKPHISSLRVGHCYWSPSLSLARFLGWCFLPFLNAALA